MNKIKKAGIILLSLATLYTGCSRSLDNKINDIKTEIEKDPKKYEETLDKVLMFSYQMKLKANNDNKTKQGCVDPKAIIMKYNKSKQGDYLSIYNKKTGQKLVLEDVYGYTQLGDSNYRFEVVKNEIKNTIYNKTKGLTEKLKKFSDAVEAFFLLEGVN